MPRIRGMGWGWWSTQRRPTIGADQPVLQDPATVKTKTCPKISPATLVGANSCILHFGIQNGGKESGRFCRKGRTRFGSFLGNALRLCFVRATAQEADDVRAFSGKRRGMFFSLASI